MYTSYVAFFDLLRWPLNRQWRTNVVIWPWNYASRST